MFNTHRGVCKILQSELAYKINAANYYTRVYYFSIILYQICTAVQISFFLQQIKLINGEYTLKLQFD